MKYKIIRFFQDSSKPKKVIQRGLSLKEAREWCNRDDTHEPGIWFDGYVKDERGGEYE